MIFKKSNSMKISVSKQQEEQLSSKKRITAALNQSNVIAFDIFDNDALVGFAMLREYKKGEYFLWDFAIDFKYQNRHYGTNALKELIAFMQSKYKMHTLTTTYKFGNEHAKHIYEKIGFTQTDVVNENGIYEVNMKYLCK